MIQSIERPRFVALAEISDAVTNGCKRVRAQAIFSLTALWNESSPISEPVRAMARHMANNATFALIVPRVEYFYGDFMNSCGQFVLDTRANIFRMFVNALDTYRPEPGLRSNTLLYEDEQTNEKMMCGLKQLLVDGTYSVAETLDDSVDFDHSIVFAEDHTTKLAAGVTVFTSTATPIREYLHIMPGRFVFIPTRKVSYPSYREEDATFAQRTKIVQCLVALVNVMIAAKIISDVDMSKITESDALRRRFARTLTIIDAIYMSFGPDTVTLGDIADTITKLSEIEPLLVCTRPIHEIAIFLNK